ncbi:MAG: hypothetical protein R2712_06290 [Vicinamibacterales bacterium]
MQLGSVYTLDGTDDQCGAPQLAPVTGLATPNPDGTIGLGLTIVTVPGGRPVHLDARITLGGLSGPWSDSAGNTGTFAFNAAAPGASRPIPSPGAAWGTVVVAPPGDTSTGISLTSDAPLASSPPAVRVTWGAPATVATGAIDAGIIVSARDHVGIAATSDSSVGVFGQTLSGVGVGGTAADGIGVLGRSSGAGIGVWGSSDSGIGVLASSTAGTALSIAGAISVGGTTRAAFAHITSASNTTAHVTTISHPLTNNDPTALVFVTHAIPTGSPTGLDPRVSSVAYDAAAGRWRILHDDFTAMPLGLQFNVLVIKQ